MWLMIAALHHRQSHRYWTHLVVYWLYHKQWQQPLLRSLPQGDTTVQLGGGQASSLRGHRQIINGKVAPTGWCGSAQSGIAAAQRTHAGNARYDSFGAGDYAVHLHLTHAECGVLIVCHCCFQKQQKLFLKLQQPRRRLVSSGPLYHQFHAHSTEGPHRCTFGLSCIVRVRRSGEAHRGIGGRSGPFHRIAYSYPTHSQ